MESLCISFKFEKKLHFPAALTKNFEFNFLFKENCSWKSCFRDFEIFLDKIYTKYFLEIHWLKHNNRLAITFWNITKVFARKEILGQIYFTPVATPSKIVIKPLWFLMQFFEALKCDTKIFLRVAEGCTEPSSKFIAEV